MYFEVATGNNLLKVEVGTGTVVATTDLTAAVQVDRSAVVEPGHLVRFDIPELRLVRPASPRERQFSSPGPGSSFYVAGDVSPCLNVRPLPAQFSAPLDCLPPGTQVNVIDRMPGWKRVHLPTGTEGWVAEAFLGSSRTDTRRIQPTPAPQRQELPDVDLMRSRLKDAEEALDASETARATLQRQLDEAEKAAATEPEVSETVADLRSRLNESSAKLDEVRGYRLRLQTSLSEAEQTRQTVTRRILDTTVANLEAQLRLTADDLRRSAEERDSLSREVVALRAAAADTSESDRTIAELSAALEEVENLRLEAERRATAAEGRNAELEVRLERAEARIAELEPDIEQPDQGREPERAPSIGATLQQSELPVQQAIVSPPPARRVESADLPADRSSPEMPPVDQERPSAEATVTPNPDAAAGENTLGPATLIEGITWQQEDGSIIFSITLDGRVSKEQCEVVRVRSGAPRDVLKIRGLRKGLSPSVIEVGEGVVDRLRAGLHWNGDESEMHIVTDLSRADVGIRTVRIRGDVLVVTVN